MSSTVSSHTIYPKTAIVTTNYPQITDYLMVTVLLLIHIAKKFSLRISTKFFSAAPGSIHIVRANKGLWQSEPPVFCLIEVAAMVVAVQQPPAECTAIFTVCIV